MRLVVVATRLYAALVVLSLVALAANYFNPFPIDNDYLYLARTLHAAKYLV